MTMDNSDHQIIIDAFNYVLPLSPSTPLSSFKEPLSRAETVMLKQLNLKANKSSCYDTELLEKFLPYYINLQTHPNFVLRRYCVVFLSKAIGLDNEILPQAIECFSSLCQDQEYHVVMAVIYSMKLRLNKIVDYIRLTIPESSIFEKIISDLKSIRNHIFNCLTSKCKNFKCTLEAKYKIIYEVLQFLEEELSIYHDQIHYINMNSFKTSFQDSFLNVEIRLDESEIQYPQHPTMKRLLSIFKGNLEYIIQLIKRLLIQEPYSNPIIFCHLIQSVGKTCAKREYYFKYFFETFTILSNIIFKGENSNSLVLLKYRKPLIHIIKMELMRILANCNLEEWEGAIVDLINKLGKSGSCEALKIEAKNIFKEFFNESRDSHFKKGILASRHFDEFGIGTKSKRMKRDPDLGNYFFLPCQRLETLSWLSSTCSQSDLVDLVIKNFQDHPDISKTQDLAKLSKIAAFENNNNQQHESVDSLSEISTNGHLKFKKNAIYNDDIPGLDNIFESFQEDEDKANITSNENELDSHTPMDKDLSDLIPDYNYGKFTSPEDMSGLVNPKSIDSVQESLFMMKKLVFTQMMESTSPSPAIGENPYTACLRFYQLKTNLIMRTLIQNCQSKSTLTDFTRLYVDKILKSEVLKSVVTFDKNEALEMVSDLDSQLKFSTINDLLNFKYFKDLDNFNKSEDPDKSYYFYLTHESPHDQIGWDFAPDSNNTHTNETHHQDTDYSNSFCYEDLFLICLDCLLEDAKRTNSEKNKFAQLLAQFFIDAPFLPPGAFRKTWEFSFDPNMRKISLAILSSIIKRSNSPITRKTCLVMALTLAHSPNSDARKFFLKLFSSPKGLYTPDLIHPLTHDDQESIKKEIDDSNDKTNEEESKSNNQDKSYFVETPGSKELMDPYYYSMKWIEDCAGLCFRSILEIPSNMVIHPHPFVELVSARIISKLKDSPIKNTDGFSEYCMLFVNLCIRKPVLVKTFLQAVNNSPKKMTQMFENTFKDIVYQLQPIPYEIYADLINCFSNSNQSLMTVISEHSYLKILESTDQYLDAKVLLEAIWIQYTKNNQIQSILPVLSFYESERIFHVLSNHIFEMNNESQLKQVVTRLLKLPAALKSKIGGYPLTPDDLLYFFCDMTTSGTEQEKHQALILDLCVDLTGQASKSSTSEQIFPLEAIASVSQKIVQDEHKSIPSSFGRLLCRTAQKLHSLGDFVSLTIMPCLIQKQIWQYPSLWKGFKLTMQLLWSEQKRNLFSTILRLPPDQGIEIMQNLQQQHTITSDLTSLILKNEQAMRSCPQYLRVLLGLGS